MGSCLAVSVSGQVGQSWSGWLACQQPFEEPTRSLKPPATRLLPGETARVAEAAVPKRKVYLRRHDQLAELDAEETFADRFAERGQPAASPACLALITVMQFAEGLSDRPAADAVRGHIDWKYAVGLDLTDPGFAACVLSEFRRAAARWSSGTAPV